jgi:hypothetical protein
MITVWSLRDLCMFMTSSVHDTGLARVKREQGGSFAVHRWSGGGGS